MTEARKQRLEELLADRALWGLEEGEQQELRHLLDEFGLDEQEALDSWETSTSLLTVAFLGNREENMPEGLAKTLETDALKHFLKNQSMSLEDVSNAIEPEEHKPRLTAVPASRPWASWLLTAAAVLLSAFLIADRFATETLPSLADQRSELVASATDLLRYDWSEGPSDLRGQPSGDVMWSDEQQSGFMTFRGLPANDKQSTQYQLWIFDKERDAAKPVDGGVFDIPAEGGEVIVPIEAKIDVREAFGFAVTVEEPGGVVVSEREHIVVLAGL